MENTERLQKYVFEDFTFITNFENFEDAQQYANERNGELVEVGFTDGSDNPLPNDDAKLMESGRVFKVGLDSEYEILYSDDEKFQEMAEEILEHLKRKENDIAPEDWLSDQNIATGDRIIIIKDGEVNTVTTRERIKFLMRGNVYELAVKIKTVE